MKKILTVTGSRSEYDLLYPLLKKLDDNKKINLNILCCGSHLDKNYGNTIVDIKKDNFKNIFSLKTIKEKNNNLEIFNSYKYLSDKVGKLLIKEKIDLLLLLGDRFEAHASATAAFFHHIPIAHISGGDTSFGSMEEYFRNSISLMSNLHFVKTNKHKDKLLNLGVNKNKIFNVGSLSNENYISKFDKSFIIDSPFVLVTFHPVTNSTNKKDNNLNDLLKSVKFYNNLNYLFTASNHDSGGKKINNDLIKFVKENKNCKFIHNLGRKLYYQAMYQCEFMIGNSSSGIIESMIYKKPSINILPRQNGRQANKNVINCQNNYNSIKKSINQALSSNFKNKCKKLKNIFYNKSKKPSKLIEKEIIKYYG